MVPVLTCAHLDTIKGGCASLGPKIIHKVLCKSPVVHIARECCKCARPRYMADLLLQCLYVRAP